MSKIKRNLTSNLNPWVETRNTTDIKNRTGNLYESIAVIAKRANQINISMKEELHSKLDEFATHTDNLEEVHENKEQIEISRFYERLANPAIQATQEFLDDKIYFRKNDDDLFS
ncbi:MAG TPA: DNA-directed RNA polymerase subunit omega [Chitinophaga sp.]